MDEGHRKRILMIEDDELFRRSTGKILQDQYEVVVAATLHEGMETLSSRSPDLVLLDMMLPDGSGIQFLRRLAESVSQPPVIMLTAIDQISTVVEAMRDGAVDYLTKPVRLEELHLAIDRALRASEMNRELEQRRSLQLASNQEIQLLGEDGSMEKVRQAITKVAPTDATVLIKGETGTGKELVARGIHAASRRASGPFVAINCGAIPKDLFESEFFGHSKGAFTGAERAAMGKLRLAHKGTLLLDEIGELPLDVQVKLLRALEEQQFYPVGANEQVHVDTRVVASTHRDLEAMVEEGTFRQDLFFRLNVFEIELPPLRERGNDILLLAQHFLGYFNRKFSKEFEGFTSDGAAALTTHPWTGNVRELRNVIERVALSESGAAISEDHLGMLRGGKRRTFLESFDLPDEGLDLEELEKRLLQQALDQAGGNKSQAARLLRMTPPKFYYRLDKYGLEPS